MDRIELQQKLTQPFDSDQWKEVVETVFPGSQFYAQARTVPTTEEIVEQITDKGTVRLADGKNIALVELRLKPGSVHLHRNRVKLRSLVAKLIDQERAHGVIAVFEQGGDDYRLSFVAREAVLEDGEFKVRETPAKRFTYLLGPGETCRTAAERLYSLSQKTELTLDDVTDAFSVEKLNKEFYRHIQKYFYQLVGGKVDARYDFTGCMTLPSTPIEDQENHKAYSEFAVRLIGRVVFCWFLKHKRCDQDRPLIPEELLSSKAVEAHGGYYHSVLEKLFFQTLNKPMNERSKYAPAFAHLIPYLNGGLFDPHHDDFYEEGAMGESKAVNTLLIPDDWFLSLFQTLEMYNFTIDENTALDSEVSIDPEILGRIFENLLAEINPETGDSARKATGSFYTPREIVDYMVEESLLQHLKTALGANADEGKLRALFIDDDQPHGLNAKTKKAVVDAFRTIKVLDPACGSGAFPVGILQKMLCALRKVDPENDYWLDAQIQHIHEMKLSKQEVDKRVEELIKAFKTNEADYGRKLGIIQNSVYGVDIQPIAIEISKLRFFLTLVVDEKINEKEDNRGILPLPNLDFKFVCANTLIPAPKIENTGDELDLEYYPDFFDDFTALTEQYFYAGNPAEKQTIRTQLSECVGKKIKGEWNKVEHIQANDLLEHASWSARKKKQVEAERKKLVTGLNLWRSYKNIFTGQPVGFFDPKYMFPDAAEGFDVVIGNPPYGTSIKGSYREQVVSYLGKVPDYAIHYFFIEIARKVLKDTGVKSFIIPNTLLFNVYASDYRKMLANHWGLLEILDCTNFVVFDVPTVHNIITIFTKSDGGWAQIGYRKTAGVKSFIQLIAGARSYLPINDLLDLNSNWGLAFKLSPIVVSLVSKFKHSGPCVIEKFPEISQGLIAYDKYTGQSPDIISSRAYHSSVELPGWKPWLKGEDVKKHCVTWSGVRYINYCEGIANPRKPKYFCNARVLVREITNPSVYAAYTERELYNDPSVINILGPSSEDLYALAGLLNSKLATFYHFNSSPKSTKGAFPKILVKDIKEFPLPERWEERSLIVDLYEKILALKKGNPEADVSALEAEIDQFVYKLYDLTSAEIGIIEGSA